MASSFPPTLASARSSRTAIDVPHVSQEPVPPLPEPKLKSPKSPLDEEIARDEAAIELYGGDDPREPEPKPQGVALTSPIASATSTHHEPEKDPNEVNWDGPDDPANPQNWTVRRKWIITLLCCIMTVNVTFASSAPTSATTGIKAQFNVPSEVTYLITTVFLLGYTTGPLFWGPGSEVVGRLPIFRVTLTLYTLFHLGQALAPNIECLLITRFISGFFACAPLANCGGVIADVWSAAGRGPATSIFTASVFIGPVIGPIISGYMIESGLEWRWVFWIMMIFAGSCSIIVIIFMPETYAPIILAKKAKKIKKEDPSSKIWSQHERQDWSFKGLVHRTLYRPFQMLFMEPVLVLITIYLSLVYGVLYALFQAFPIVFITKRHFTIGQDGLIFIGVGIGAGIGSFLNYYLSRHYPTLIKTWKGFPPPEQRLYGAMIGGPGLVIGAFWLGWTGQYPSVPWYVPGLATIVLGASISMIFMSFLSYLVDTYLMFSASAFAANTMVRSAVAAAFPLFTVQMFTNLGVNWACTLIGLIALILAPSPFLFYKFGPAIRTRSKFAPCIDLKIAAAMKEEQANAEKSAQSA